PRDPRCLILGWYRWRCYGYLLLLQLFDAQLREVSVIGVLETPNESFESSDAARVLGCCPSPFRLVRPQLRCWQCVRRLGLPRQEDAPSKTVAFPRLLGSARRCQHAFFDVLEEVEMVEPGRAKLGGECRRVRSTPLAAVGSRVSWRAGISDEHALLLSHGYEPLGGVLGRQLQLVAAGVEHDELGGRARP